MAAVLTTNLPKYIIRPTAAIVQRLREQYAKMIDADYNLDQIGSGVLEALHRRDESGVEILAFLDHFSGWQTTKEDQSIARAALTPLCYDLLRHVDVLGIRDHNGALPYVFGNWMGDDLIIMNLPY